MEKKIALAIVVLCMSFTVFAIDISLDITAGGLGPSFMRGAYIKETNKHFADSGMQVKNGTAARITSTASVNAVLEFIPYLGIEAGLGFGISTSSLKVNINKLSTEIPYEFRELMIPVMLRLQLPIAKFNIYAGFGANFNIVLSGEGSVFNDSGELVASELKKEYYTGFITDLVFALGVEYVIAKRHFLGLRTQYNLGVTDRVTKKYADDNIFTSERGERALLLFDSLGFSFTYRYKF
ncbi:MAG: outer membrane beta-barrel protein [Treponemataceae bacterium]